VAVIGGCVERESPREWTLPHHQVELTNDGRSKCPPPLRPLGSRGLAGPATSQSLPRRLCQMRLAECHITRPEVQHCHHLWVFDLRRRAGDIRRPMSLASMHVVPLPMTVETACGVRAVCCHMVMVNAVEAAPHQVHQNRLMRLLGLQSSATACDGLPPAIHPRHARGLGMGWDDGQWTRGRHRP
jgi:hypothetical protein